MATELIMKRQGYHLVPATAHDMEILETVAMGQPVMANLRRSRSLQHQRFYWALLGHIARAHPIYKRPQQLHIALKHSLGYVDRIIDHRGELITVVGSTAFDSMDQTAFKAFFDAALQLILEEVVPDVKRADLLRPVERMLGLRYGDLWGASD